jgi:hypothetical protein
MHPAVTAARAASIALVLAPLCDSTMTSGGDRRSGISARKSCGSCTSTGPRRAATKAGRATCKALKEDPAPTSAMPSKEDGAQVDPKVCAAARQRSSAAGCSRM